jgi:hypothetical protein
MSTFPLSVFPVSDLEFRVIAPSFRFPFSAFHVFPFPLLSALASRQTATIETTETG